MENSVILRHRRVLFGGFYFKMIVEIISESRLQPEVGIVASVGAQESQGWLTP